MSWLFISLVEFVFELVPWTLLAAGAPVNCEVEVLGAVYRVDVVGVTGVVDVDKVSAGEPGDSLGSLKSSRSFGVGSLLSSFLSSL